MFRTLFFIAPFTFFILGVIFTLCIAHIEKVPGIVNLNIGKLDGDDIRKLDKKERNYLQNQLLYRFIIAVVITLLISLGFIILGDADNAILVSLCNFINLIVGLVVVLSVLKKTNKLKNNLL